MALGDEVERFRVGFPIFGKLFSFAVASAFSFTLIWAYREQVSPIFTYMGFSYLKPPAALYMTALIAALLPSLLLPLRLSSVGGFFLWVLYYTLYLPAILLPVMMGTLPERVCYSLVEALTASFLLMCVPPLNWVASFPSITMTTEAFWSAFAIVYVILTISLIVVFGGHLQLASVENIYSQRSVGGELGAGSLGGYASGMLAGAFNPFLIALGLANRRPSLVLLGMGGQVLVYATAAMKSVLLSVVMIPGFYFLVFRREPYRLNKVGFTFTAAALSLLFAYIALQPKLGSLMGLAFSMVFMRTFCMVGVLTGVYTEFFLTHPLTYFSHVGVVQRFVPYPYPDALGNMIGYFMIPSVPPMDANASFFATDGLAAFGVIGIVFAGFLFRMIMALFNTCTNKRSLALACCALVPFLVNVANSSMFTSMVTGGGGLLAVLLYFYSNAKPTHGSIDAAKPQP